MRKKKVLVHGTLESLQKFFSDSSSHDFETVALLNEENSSSELAILTKQNLPKFIYTLVDGIIITDVVQNREIIKYFLNLGVEPHKIILWNLKAGWCALNLPDKDGKEITYFYGLEFHTRNEDDIKFFNKAKRYIQNQRKRKNLEPQDYPALLSEIFKKLQNKPLDFDNLQTFTEKLQWIKLFDATELKSRLSDKYLVRSWVAEKIGAQYLIPLLGVWNNFDDINFDLLPNQFVLKCNHGFGMNIIVRDKNSFDFERAREKINAWLTIDFGAQNTLELHYTRIDRKIIAESFLTDGAPELTDYRFLCFGGKIIYCQCLTDRSANPKLDYFDENWNVTNVERNDYPRSEQPENIPPPQNFELMKKLATTLAQDFAFVRVDFYEVEGKVYFGRMSFTPVGGNFSYKSEDTDEFLGQLLEMPALTPPLEFPNFAEHRVRKKFSTEIKFPTPKIIPERKIIASLTSWTKRIGKVHFAIQTILNQTLPPDLTVLYLADEEFPHHEDDLPKELLELCSKRFEIRWTKNIRSYKKLIPTLKDFPNDIIITFDDDLLYHRELIERVFAGYKKYPEMINCHRINNIFFDETGQADFAKNKFVPYDRPTYLNKISSGLSCLFPPHSLHEDVLREDKFLTLAPTNDDLWFWLMAMLNGRRVNVVENNIDKLSYVPGTQDVSLWHINNLGERLLFKDLEKILNAYPALREILYYEQQLADGQ